jgi:hypothetical protein
MGSGDKNREYLRNPLVKVGVGTILERNRQALLPVSTHQVDIPQAATIPVHNQDKPKTLLQM